ncbi:MAG: HAMP domain-containing protein [Acidimicrobiia bacterium]
MRRRLVLLAGAVAAMVVVAFLVPLAFLVRDLARDRALSTAERNAQIVAQNLSLVPPDDVVRIEAVLATVAVRSEEKMSVLLADDAVVGEPFEMGELEARARLGESITTGAPGGAVIVVPVVQAAGNSLVVRSFVPGELLTQNVWQIVLLLAVLGMFLILIAVVVADRMGRSLVQPVRELSEAAGRVSHGDLDVRVEPSGPPEVVEVGSAFNRLVERIGALLSSERESVADLAHRLRTPLTALRLDIEGLDDRVAVEELVHDVDELEKTVDFVIEEARRPVREGAGVATDLGVVARDRATFWGALAEDQGRRWEVAIDPGPHPVGVNATDLAAAIDAMIGNVFDHTPDGVGFAVVVAGTEAGSRLVVMDEGPGFPHAAVVERGTSTGESTGLGLDIARRTAEAAGGTFSLPEDQGGAQVSLEFPAFD